jgi:chaperonin GroES
MLKPLEDKIVIEPVKEEEVSKSGLIITSSGNEKPSEGVVVAIGPGITLQDGSKVVPELSVGDKVVFSKYGATEVEHDGKDYLILAYRDILVVLGE